MGRVFSGFDQEGFAFHEQSADDPPFLIVELDFHDLVSGATAKSPAVGNNLAVVAKRKLSEPANFLSFHAKSVHAHLFLSAEGDRPVQRLKA